MEKVKEVLEEPGEVVLMQADFDLMIEKERFEGKRTVMYRDDFVKVSPYCSGNAIVSMVKEYLCEAF